MKKFSFLAALMLPLFIATAASAGPVYENPIGLTVREPVGVTINPAGNPLATIWNNGTGYTQEIINNTAQAATLINTPVIATVFDSSGNEWISNWNSHTVTKYVAGVATATIDIPGTTSAWGIAVDASGNLWVTDYFAGKLTEIINGVVQSPISVQSGAFGVAIDKLGAVWVGTFGGAKQIQKVVNGVLQATIQLSINPAGVAVDPYGNIWVVDGSTGNLQEIINGVPQTVISNPNPRTDLTVQSYAGLAIDRFGNIWIDGGLGSTSFIQKITGAFFNQNTTPDVPTGLAAATVSHTTMKLSWNYQTSPTTQFICTASNGATATVTGTSCSLKGFDLYNPGSYSFSVIAVVDGVQSDAAVLSVSVK